MKAKAGFLMMALAVVMATGCASIVSNSVYPVSISSSPEGSSFKVFNKAGLQVYSGTTPNTVMLKAGAGYFQGETYKVEMSKNGYEPQTVMVDSGYDGWLIGNVLIGGFIGILIVDPLTGAMFTLPENVSTSLQPVAMTLNSGDAALNLVSLTDVPDHLRSQLVELH